MIKWLVIDRLDIKMGFFIQILIDLKKENSKSWPRGSVSYLSVSVVSVRVKPDYNGYGELVFKSGEGAWEIATTSKDGSRRENYPMLIQRGSDEK